MIRYYVMPIITVPVGDRLVRIPKYIFHEGNEGGVAVQLWSPMDYGLIDACIVACMLTQEQHEILVAEPDCVAAPEILDNAISEIAIPKVQQVLEALRIPADWVTSAYTYRQILRMMAGLFQFAQRHHGLHNEALIDNVDQLDITWSVIPADRKARILQTADSLGYVYTDVTSTWTVRRILKYLGDQWGTRVFLFGFTSL